MHWNRLYCVSAFLVLVVCQSVPASAYHRDFRFPLMGRNEYYIASGSAHYLAKINVPHSPHVEELTITVKRVPFPKGTVLVVDVDGETMGNITLDARQSGELKISAQNRKFVPILNSGSIVTVRKVDGTIIAW